jgi:hypothetical protein
MSAPANEEVHLPFPAPSKALLPLTTQFRSTWLTSSVRAVKGRGRWGDYLAALPREYHDAVENSVAGVWLPVNVAIAHYDACDQLNFTPMELFAIGGEVHTTAQASVFSMLVKLATGAGATPWTATSQFNRLWSRVWVGGGVAVYKLGPKEARLELAGWQCSRSTYIRHAMRGVVTGMLEMFCRKAYMTDIPRLCTPTSLAYRCAWA